MSRSELWKQLKHRFRLLAGLPPGAPTDAEMVDVVAYIELVQVVREPMRADWQEAARIYTRNAGMCKYSGDNFGDINRILLMIQQTGRPTNSGGSSGTVRK
jgi:hypothetical protein